MQKLADAAGRVTIRVNVDRDNPGAGRDVVRMFSDRGCRDSRIDFRLGFLSARDDLIDCIPHNCFSGVEFVSAENEFRSFLASEGYTAYDLPCRQKHACSAPLMHSFTIDPLGRIGKCLPAMGTEEGLSKIYPDDIGRTIVETSQASTPYGDFDPFKSIACQGCAYLPICLGACPKLHAAGAEPCRLKEGFSRKILFSSSWRS